MPDPPPLPHPPVARVRRWYSHPVAILLFILAGIFLLLALFAGAGFAFHFTARDFTPTASQRACLFTVEEAAKTWTLTPNPSLETLSAKRFLDGSKEIDYYYEDYVVDDIYLNCTLTIERNRSDTLSSYAAEWGGFKLGSKIPVGTPIDITNQDHLFSWGDASHFAFQETGGAPYGFAFIARKGNRIYFLDAWGLELTDPAEIDATLRPVLERFEKTSF